MRTLIISALLALPFLASAQANTDIWLLRIDVVGDKINLTQPENITARKGYDNQPGFSPDGKKIYFSSMPEGTTTTDIYSYDLSKKIIEQFTLSKTSEFSPTFVPGNHGISVVMVEEDSTQRIWEFDLTGKRTRNIFPKNDSVGYYAWVNPNSVIAFILGNGKNQPHRLSLIQRDGKEKMIDDSIGRGMKVFNKGAFYIKMVNTEGFIYYTDLTKTKQLIMAPGKSLDMVIFKNKILMASDGIVYAATIEMTNNKVTGLSAFSPIADLSGYGMKNMGRLAVSPNGKFLAVVNTD
jgi:hypothetical protein